MDSVYGANAPVPEDLESILASIHMNPNREQFFLHAASLDIPRHGVSVSAKEPSFWKEITYLFD